MTGPLTRALASIRSQGADCDALAFHLTEWQVATLRAALVPLPPGDGVALTFRGVPVYADATDGGYLVVPPSPYNDRRGSTGLRVDIEGAVA